MQMPGRSYSSGNQYRYGFNGKELDNEVVQYDYGFRIYDPRLVRFKSVDPLTKEYAWYTPYQFAGNNPIGSIDIDGLEPDVTWNANETKTIQSNEKVSSNINDIQCGKNDETCKQEIAAVKQNYDAAQQVLASGKAKGYTTAVNNLQFYLNGTGGTKMESYNYLSGFSSFKSADARLNDYLETQAIGFASQVKPGETKTFNLSRKVASITASMIYERDLYAASGTSFIAATGTATISKGNDGKPVITITAAKTWIDTYDWHPGLGIRIGAFKPIGDEQMSDLQNFGAQGFEMRSYFTSTLKFTGKFEKHYIEHGMSYQVHQWSEQSVESNKTNKHYDVPTTRGYH